MFAVQDGTVEPPRPSRTLSAVDHVAEFLRVVAAPTEVDFQRIDIIRVIAFEELTLFQLSIRPRMLDHEIWRKREEVAQVTLCSADGIDRDSRREWWPRMVVTNVVPTPVPARDGAARRARTTTTVLRRLGPGKRRGARDRCGWRTTPTAQAGPLAITSVIRSDSHVAEQLGAGMVSTADELRDGAAGFLGSRLHLAEHGGAVVHATWWAGSDAYQAAGVAAPGGRATPGAVSRHTFLGTPLVSIAGPDDGRSPGLPTAAPDRSRMPRPRTGSPRC